MSLPVESAGLCDESFAFDPHRILSSPSSRSGSTDSILEMSRQILGQRPALESLNSSIDSDDREPNSTRGPNRIEDDLPREPIQNIGGYPISLETFLKYEYQNGDRQTEQQFKKCVEAYGRAQGNFLPEQSNKDSSLESGPPSCSKNTKKPQREGDLSTSQSRHFSYEKTSSFQLPDDNLSVHGEQELLTSSPTASPDHLGGSPINSEDSEIQGNNKPEGSRSTQYLSTYYSPPPASEERALFFGIFCSCISSD